MQDTNTRNNLWAQNLEGLPHSCSCCKHDRHEQVQPCDYLHNSSMPKMPWKVVANILCVVVCKPNDLDDIKCIWELDDEPQYTFHFSKQKVLLINENFAIHSLKPRGVDSLGGVVYHVRPKFATPILHVINNFKNYEFFSTYT